MKSKSVKPGSELAMYYTKNKALGAQCIASITWPRADWSAVQRRAK